MQITVLLFFCWTVCSFSLYCFHLLWVRMLNVEVHVCLDPDWSVKWLPASPIGSYTSWKSALMPIVCIWRLRSELWTEKFPPLDPSDYLSNRLLPCICIDTETGYLRHWSQWFKSQPTDDKIVFSNAMWEGNDHLPSDSDMET